MVRRKLDDLHTQVGAKLAALAATGKEVVLPRKRSLALILAKIIADFTAKYPM